MGFYDHVEEFGGKKVVFLNGDSDDSFTDPETQVPHISVGWDDSSTFMERFQQLLAQPEADNMSGLLIGAWAAEMYDVPVGSIVEALVAAAPQLPSLRYLFVGEMTQEENEVSWIQQGDLRPLLNAFPDLQVLVVRGSEGLTIGPVQHGSLQQLVIETGGLPPNILDEITKSELPNLTDLTVYLGQDHYGWDGGIETVKSFVNALDRFPKLTSLGLCNANGELTDQIAEFIADHPILDRLEELDLSSGTLGDEGAKFLLESERVKTLKSLDVTHNFLSDEMRADLKALPLEVEADANDAWRDDDEDDDFDGRYCAISE